MRVYIIARVSIHIEHGMAACLRLYYKTIGQRKEDAEVVRAELARVKLEIACGVTAPSVASVKHTVFEEEPRAIVFPEVPKHALVVTAPRTHKAQLQSAM